MFAAPPEVQTTVFSSVPEELRRTGEPSDMLKRHRSGHEQGSLLEGPSFDRDGNLDFVTANYRGKSMNIYAGKGDGTFTSKGIFPGNLRLREGSWTLHSVQ